VSHKTVAKWQNDTVKNKEQEKIKAWRGKLRWDGNLKAMRTDAKQ